MHDHIHASCGRSERVEIAHVSTHQLYVNSRKVRLETAVEIVDHRNVVSVVDKSATQIRTDESGPACH
jgi:hypothetical protein